MTRFIKIKFIILLFLSKGLIGQNITGVWEGIMNDEYLRVNILQEKNELCGYTYDIALRDKQSHCKSYFKGFYNEKTSIWTIKGVSFINNSGNHVLMTIRLWQIDKANKNALRGNVTTNSFFSEFFKPSESDNFWIRRISTIPEALPNNKPICFDNSLSTKNSTAKKIPKKNITNNEKYNKIINQNEFNKYVSDSTQVINSNEEIFIQPSVVISPNIQHADRSLIESMSSRKKSTISTIIVQDKNIQLALYDNGIVDNDTVSVFYNGKLIKSKQGLSEAPIILNITLDETSATHEITLYADNMGTMAPNTALIVLTAGKKRYELHSSASLEENAVLFIEYHPN